MKDSNLQNNNENTPVNDNDNACLRLEKIYCC